MEGNMSKVMSLLSELSLSDEPKKHLIELKTTLITLTAPRIKELPSNLNLNVLFDSFNSSDSEQVELTVDILTHLLPFVSPKEVVERFSEHLLRGLAHPHEKVRTLVLKEIQLCSDTDTGVMSVVSDAPLLLGVVSGLGDSSLGVVKVACDTLLTVCKQTEGIRAVFSSESVSTMQSVMAKSDSCRFNVYDMLVQVCLLGDLAMSTVSNSGLLDRLTAEVTTGDVLTQLNALELLTTLVVSRDGMALLHRAGVVAKLQYLLSLAENDPMAALLMPGLIKFFGNMGHSQPRRMVEEYGSVMVMILRLAAGTLDLGDPTFQLVAIETVVHIGSSPEGILALAKFKTEMDEVLDVIGTKMRTAPTDQRVRILEALAQLFTVEQEDQSEGVVGTLELWWPGVAGVNLEKLMAVARQPFADLHCAALKVLKALAYLDWGQKLIRSEPGLVEYILNRATENESSGKVMKWEIVKTLVLSGTASSIFDEFQMEQLNKYYRQGVFYVETQVEVAMEGEN
ncbi:26S proteasome non-ATPase regulatory subunit 5-like isoform X1 [Penaeus indicus]|uniref:26S proteasome non-ATPase regulatory subunit 5-like isoform X1 n=1 Tax=Penaeus indicus TaxID=29960 RepID=UPI00300CB8C8